MTVSEQCRIAASKGNQVLGMIRRNISYKEKSLIIPLYKAIVRHHLEYCIHAWNPHLRNDVDMLENIQRRETKLIPELRDLTYEERLMECGLTTLETRRLRGDQIEVFNILNGYENIDSNFFFEIKESKLTRGHNYTLVKKQSRLDVRTYSFSQRTTNGLKQLIVVPTRVCINKASAIDLILVSDPEKVCQSGVLCVGISGHLLTYCTRKVTICEQARNNPNSVFKKI